MKNLSSRTRILVVEDEVKQVADMEMAWKAIGQNLDVLVFARTRADAQRQLLMRRFQAISHDLSLATVSGSSRMQDRDYLENSDHEGGREVLQAPGASLLARRIVYTGFRETYEGLKVLDLSARQGFFYLQKGVNAPSDFPPKGNAYAWAACLLHLAGGHTDDEGSLDFMEKVEAKHSDLKARLTPYFEAYWRDAPSRLPEPLAREALVIYEAVARGRFGADHLLAANRFRLWSLILARAQTGALAASCSLRWPNDSPPAKDEDGAGLHLESLFQRAPESLATLWDAWPSWLSHLGGFEVGRTLALGPQAKALRGLRNDQVHSLKAARNLHHDLDDLREPLMALMDVAAYWADFPWFMNLRFEGGRWSGLVPQGHSASQWRTQHLPNNLVRKFSGGRGSDDRIHQVQWRRLSSASTASEAADNFAPELVDAWPWLRRFRAADGSDTVLALWYPIHRQERGGRTLWQAYTYSGQAVQITVADSDWQAKS